MGLVLAALSAAGSTFADQWKEYFYCDALSADTICVKGIKRTSGFSGNHGSDNIITDGSIIAVADGQCMIIVENGQVVDICAEPGEYKYDSKTEPSIFTGSLGEGVKNVFAEIGKRFQFGGQPAGDQRIYYFNTKEIPGLKYGTAAPVPFRVVDARANMDITISVKCFGEYSIKIADPVLFYTNVCGNVSGAYKVSEIENMMRSELLTALQPAFAAISAKGVGYAEVPAHTYELTETLNEILSKKWKELRGIEIVSFGMNSIKANEADEKRIQDLQVAATYTSTIHAAAGQTYAGIEALQNAAKNEGGAAVGFMNYNAAAAAAGVNPNALYAQAAAEQAAAPKPEAPAEGSWTCPKCGKSSTGNFCPNCGTAKPVDAKWICPKCGRENDGNFCANCGTARQ
ncbi:MAG: SPFH domain-containing protein [Erysipelotrichaceae bacterium]|nr:SPFH domain-containing protein [Erysipelotrichaceae bacterium]